MPDYKIREVAADAASDCRDASKRIAQLEAENTQLRAEQSAMLTALKKARQFIYYARYELQPGKAVLGDQFPKQEDADNVTGIIEAAISKCEALATGTPPAPKETVDDIVDRYKV